MKYYLPASLYSKRSIEILHKEIDQILSGEKRGISSQLLLIAGATGDKSFLPKLKQIQQYQQDTTIQARNDLRALARLGDKEAIQECIRMVDSLPTPIDRLLSLRKLSYVQQPEVVEYIWRYLESDEIESYPNSNDLAEPPFYTRASWALSSMLVDYPYNEPIEKQREWMKYQYKWKFHSQKSFE